MIFHLLILALSSVSHAQGWSYPVISIDVPKLGDWQTKDIIVTDGNHIHQVWYPFEEQTRVGHNIVLPDGTEILGDRMLSLDIWSAYESISWASDSTVIAFWRQNYASIWYSVMDTDGNTIIPPTLYSSEGWYSWPLIDSSPDSLGRIHIVRNLPDRTICYSVLEPGLGELFRDTIPDSQQQSLVVVDGNRVHIKYSGYPDECARYIQYDLEGNVTIPPVVLVDDELNDSDRCSMTLDSEGNAMVFLVETPSASYPRFVSLYKVDKDAGTLLIDQKVIFQPTEWTTLKEPFILPRPGAESFYLLWGEGELGGSPHIHYIKLAIIDSDGNFIEEPYVAYDYSDEDPQDLERIAADVNSDGDVFVHWSAFFSEIDSYYIVLGWFDHNWVSVESEDFGELEQISMAISASVNPFSDFLELAVSGGAGQISISVFDLQGRHVITLIPDDQGFGLWDGTDSSGIEVPTGAYVIRAEAGTNNTSLLIIKL